MAKCSARGCKRDRGKDQIFCRAHWFGLPKSVRDEIWRLYRTEPGSDRHRRAVFAAIMHVSRAIRKESAG